MIDSETEQELKPDLSNFLRAVMSESGDCDDLRTPSGQLRRRNNSDDERETNGLVSGGRFNVNDIHATCNGNENENENVEPMSAGTVNDSINIGTPHASLVADMHMQPSHNHSHRRIRLDEDGEDVPVRVLNYLPSNNSPHGGEDGKSSCSNQQYNDVAVVDDDDDAMIKEKGEGQSSSHERERERERNAGDIINNKAAMSHDRVNGGGAIETNNSNSCSNELPIVDRLPSRNISFGSGEILTVPELSQCIHATHPTSENQETLPKWKRCHTDMNGFDVRVTGVILHMHTGIHNKRNKRGHDGDGDGDDIPHHSEDSWIVLGDALFVPNKQKQKQKLTPRAAPNQKLHRTGNVNSATKDGVANANANANADPKTTSIPVPVLNKSSLGGGGGSGGKQLLSGKKRKLVTVKPNHNSLLERVKNRTARTIHRTKTGLGIGIGTPTVPMSEESKQAQAEVSSSGLFGIMKQKVTNQLRKSFNRGTQSSKLEELKQKSQSGMKMVAVNITNMACIDGCKVGDLITIVGCTVFLDRASASAFVSASRSESTSLNEVDSSNGTNNGIQHLNSDSSVEDCNSMEKIAELVGGCQSHLFPEVTPKAETEEGLAQGQPFSPSSTIATDRYRYGYLDARILTVANGLDMCLFEKALELRRLYLQSS